MTKLYRNHGPLHTLEPHYSAHVSAMTSEALHGKGQIAAELAYRDARIVSLEAMVDAANHAIAESADEATRLDAEIEELKAERGRLDAQTTEMVDRIRLYCSQGTGLPIESIGGMEGAVVNLAVEARTMRRERDEARSEIERLLNGMKGEIAAELAYRDARIEELKAALTPLAHGRAAYTAAEWRGIEERACMALEEIGK